MSKAKKTAIIVLAVVVIAAGLGILGYPVISNFLMSQNLDSEVQTYLDSALGTDEDSINAELARAQEYNSSLVGSVLLGDPFAEDSGADDDYYDILNLDGTSVMACVEIPAINVKYPVYHGTSTQTLEKGVGHLRNTSLPVGGKGTHAVLTGHSGVSGLKIFTDLEKLEVGDMFYIYVLNKTLAYEIDNIAVVLPSDTSLLKIEEDKDLVTLVTCTPYGKNTHRLLVRGHAVPYSQQKAQTEREKSAGSTYDEQYSKGIVIGLCVLAGVLAAYFGIGAIVRKTKRKKHNETQGG